MFIFWTLFVTKSQILNNVWRFKANFDIIYATHNWLVDVDLALKGPATLSLWSQGVHYL